MSIKAHHHLQVRSIDCSGLQNGCQLYYLTADSVLTRGCSFIRQHISINIFIMLAILGWSIKSKRISTGKRCMWIRITGQQIDDFMTLRSGSVTSWGGSSSRLRWIRLWSRLRTLLSMSVGRSCTCMFAFPVGLQIVCGASLARKASGSLVLTKHCRVSFYRSLYLFMPRKLNTPHCLLSDLGARFVNQELGFLYYSAQNASFGYFRHIQGQVHVRLFQLYPTSFLCHCRRHVENLQEISSCL
jgi:hypothetical protein